MLVGGSSQATLEKTGPDLSFCLAELAAFWSVLFVTKFLGPGNLYPKVTPCPSVCVSFSPPALVIIGIPFIFSNTDRNK